MPSGGEKESEGGRDGERGEDLARRVGHIIIRRLRSNVKQALGIQVVCVVAVLHDLEGEGERERGRERERERR